MSDFEKATLTALFAVIVYVAGQLIQKLFLEPIQEQRRLIGETAFILVFYANVDKPTIEEEANNVKQTRQTIRKLASQLQSTLWTIPAYRILAFLHFVPKRSAIKQAVGNLIGFSNSLGEIYAYEKREAVAKALRIDF